MPVTYYREDMVLELKQALAAAEDNLKAEFAAHGKTLERLHRTEERLSRAVAALARAAARKKGSGRKGLTQRRRDAENTTGERPLPAGRNV